jgi:adenylate kinase
MKQRFEVAARMAVAAGMFLAGAAAQGPGKGLVIVLIGPPGSGKTTQSELLVKKYRIPVLAGDQLRIKAGGSTEKLNAMLREQVLSAERQKGFVIDGYPATRAEADYLGKIVKEAGLPQPIVIQIDVPDVEVRKRMKDAADADFEKRLAQYHKELEMAISYYPQSDIWQIIGTLPPAEVFKTIVALIEDRQ